MALYLGVDVGASGTRAVLVDGAGAVRGTGTGDRGQMERGAALAAAAIAEAAGAALETARAAWSDVTGACFAVSGLDHDWQLPALREALGAAGLPEARLENDTLAAWAGGTGLRPGAVAVGGTGHNVLAVDALGARCWQKDLGNLNRLIALPRPGWQVGWTAIGLGLAAPEGSPLARTTLRYLDAPDAASAIEALREEQWTPGYGAAEVAGLAAEAGDPLAAILLRTAGVGIGANVVLALRRLGMAAADCPVVYVGGLFRSPHLLAGFREAVEGACPRARLQPPLLPPVVGAALLAMDGADAATCAALERSARLAGLA